MSFRNPPPEAIRALLERVRRIAVVGLSPKANRPSHQVAAAMQGFGYQIVPVRPAIERVLGETAYPDLRAVPGTIDLVDVFRAPAHVDELVELCIECGIPALWLQDGVVNTVAAERAVAAGMFVIMDRCIYRDYVGFFGHRPRV